LKTFLIILVVLAYLGGFGALIGISKAKGIVPVKIILVLTLVIAANFLCSWILYKRASKRKAEWALFGAVGNINALLFFWLFGHK